MLTPSIASPTAEKMKLSITQNGQTAERSQIYSGGLYALTTPSLALFEQRDIKIRFAWENYPDVYTEETITAIGGTKETLRLAIEPASGSVSDNQTLTVKVKVGEYSKDGLVYTPETMGQWRTQIVAQTNTQSVKTPITAMQDMVNGEATFQINPAGNLFMKLTAISELVTSIPGLNVSLNSLIKYIEVVKGTPIEGTISAKMLEAPAPKSFTLDLNLSQDNRVALKAVSWQESLDSGATWSDIPNSNVVRKSIAMLDPERKKVRVKMINKNTLVESFTAPVELLTYPKLDAVISGPLNTGPGKPVTLRANVYNDGNKISSPVVEWTVISGAGKTNYTGENLTVTEAQEGKLTITMRARSAITSADDIEAWAYTRATLVVKNPLTPSIYAVGPRELEVGKTYYFDGSAKPSWGSGPSGLNIIFEWELPDGTIKSGYQLDWTPSIDSLSNEKPLIYRAWVEGFKDTTTIERTLIYKMWQYVWPTFTMSMKQLTPEAPSDLLLMVNYNQPGMSSRFEGLTYTWSFPTNVTGRQNDAFPNRATAQALFAGEYDVKVTIQDTRGHQTVLTQHIVAEQAAPYTATLKVGKSNVFDRVPMTVTVRPTIYGGHPLDSVIAQSWKIDGMPIDEYVNRDYLVSNITGTGNHVISYTINSRMGKTATINSPLTLISNKLPVCLLNGHTQRLCGLCRRQMHRSGRQGHWLFLEVNGEPIGATSYRISFGKTTTPQSASVTITAMDDAKELSLPVSITVNY